MSSSHQHIAHICNVGIKSGRQWNATTTTATRRRGGRPVSKTSSTRGNQATLGQRFDLTVLLNGIRRTGKGIDCLLLNISGEELLNICRDKPRKTRKTGQRTMLTTAHLKPKRVVFTEVMVFRRAKRFAMRLVRHQICHAPQRSPTSIHQSRYRLGRRSRASRWRQGH
jgi:hypothetical protein